MSEVDLSIDLAGLHLNNPIIAGSGTFGYGEEFERFTEISRIGGICVKGTSAQPIEGNLPPRLFPTASGMLNSLGFLNRRVARFIPPQVAVLPKADTAASMNV